MGACVLQLVVQDKPGFADTVGEFGMGKQIILAVIQTEAESGKGCHGAAGGICQLLLHIQHHITACGIVAVMEGNLDMPAAVIRDFEILIAVEGGDVADLQMSVHIGIGDDNTKGMHRGIVGDAVLDFTGVGLDDLIGVGAGGGELLRLHGFGEAEGRRILGGGGGGDGDPTVISPFLELELELGAIPVVCGGGHGFDALHFHVDGVDGIGNILVDHHDGGGLILYDHHDAVAGFAVIHVHGAETVGGIPLHHGGNGTGGQTGDLQLLLILQNHGETALGIGGDGCDGTVGVDCIEGGIGGADAAQADVHDEGQILGDGMVAAKGMVNVLGDGQTAGAPLVVDEGQLCQGLILHGDFLHGLFGDIVQRFDFFYPVVGAGGHAADGDALPRV